MLFTAWTVISSTMERFAAMKSSTPAASGKRAVNENAMSLRFLRMSMPIHIWNPKARRAAMMHTRACRKNVLKLATEAICAVMSIMSSTRYGIFSLYAIVISLPSGPAIDAKSQKNIENMSAVDMPR